jgi:hypothetical protein
MNLLRKIFISSVILALFSGLGGCASSMIGVTPGANRVSLAEASQVTACESKGKRNVSVIARLGLIPRNPEDVEDNLFQVARNNAVEDGADTVVKGESKELGKRTFEMYKCRP